LILEKVLNPSEGWGRGGTPQRPNSRATTLRTGVIFLFSTETSATHYWIYYSSAIARPAEVEGHNRRERTFKYTNFLLIIEILEYCRKCTNLFFSSRCW